MLLTFSWEQRRLGEIYKVNNERNKVMIDESKTLSVATMNYKLEGNGATKESLKNYKVLRLGDIAFEGHTNKEFSYGRFVLNDKTIGIMSPRFTSLRPLEDMPIRFWKIYIHYEPIMRRILVKSTKLGTMMNELVSSDFLKQSILQPSKPEQIAIGQFFELLDHHITVQQRKSVSKDEVMNLFLCKSNALVDIDVYANSWEQRRLGECFSESIERTENGDLLSVTIDSGVKRFNELDRKDNSSEDKSNYKKVVVGDLVYNSMRMWQGACGTSAYNGLVSPAYTVLHVKKENIAKFFEYMFKRRESLNSFQKHSQGMTSDTWNLKFPLFSKIKMNLPSGYEQKKISNFFELLDHHITFQQRM